MLIVKQTISTENRYIRNICIIERNNIEEKKVLRGTYTKEKITLLKASRSDFPLFHKEASSYVSPSGIT